MNPQNSGRPISEKSSLREKVRKAAIVFLLLGLLLPVLLVNIGVNAGQAGWPEPLRRLDRPFPSLDALMLCQRWYLFTYIPSFNYNFVFVAELTDGQTVLLRDLDKEKAGKWKSILFHNEPKTENNLYGNVLELRQYMEYLIRTNGLDPASIGRRISYIHYQNVLPRDQAEAAGTVYAPEAYVVGDIY